MDIQSLIRLAHQADLEGNYRVADKLTERAIREAQFLRNIGRNIGDFFGNMNVGRGSRDIANQSLNIGTGNAGGGGGGVVQQAVGAAADAAADFKMKTKNTGARTVFVTLPDGRQVPTTGNMNRLLSPEVFNSLSPEDQALVKSRSRGMSNLTQGTQTTQAGAAAAGAASAAGGAADSSASGIFKADRSKSHNISGITGPAAIGILGTGAAGMLGAQALANRPGPGPVAPGPKPGPGPVPPVMPGMPGQDFKANQLAERSQANQMQDAQMAQNFIQMRKGLPNFTTAQDFFYAAQAAGMTPGQMNQVAALAKAEGFRDKTPMMN
jgi:hypothetical protein